VTRQWLATKKFAVLSCFALALTPAAFAETAATPPPEADWDGNLHPCENSQDPACWNSNPFPTYRETQTWYPLIMLGGGLVLNSTVGQSKSFQIRNPTTDEYYYYTAQKPSQSGAFFEIFLGSEWRFQPRFALQTGVDFDQVYTNYQASGSFLQGTDAQSQNQYNYSYSATCRQVLAEAKLLYQKNRFHPYLLLGLGLSFNSAYDYNTNVPPFLTFTRQFSNQTSTAFSYAAGLGVDFDLTEAVRLGLGYRFTDLGTVSLGPANINGNTVSGTLSQNHLYANMLLAQLSFLF